MINSAKNGTDWVTCYLGLGSNLSNELGTPVKHLQQAIDKLSQNQDIKDIRVSSFYVSDPMGPQDQPDFVNAVVGFETTLSAFALLDVCQQLEAEALRVKKRRWGERSLDVDVLLYGQKRINEPRLTVPHAGLCDRNFVLVPLRELAPMLEINGQNIKTLPLSDDWSGLKLYKKATL